VRSPTEHRYNSWRGYEQNVKKIRSETTDKISR